LKEVLGDEVRFAEVLVDERTVCESGALGVKNRRPVFDDAMCRIGLSPSDASVILNYHLLYNVV